MRMKFFRCSVLAALGCTFLAAACGPGPSSSNPPGAGGQEPAADTETFRIQDIRPGVEGPGLDFFSATIVNKTDREQRIGLDLRADPGLWLRKSQRQFAFRLGPNETKRVEAAIVFLHLSREATLRVSFGVPGVSEWGVAVGDVFFRKTYPVGGGDAKIDYDLSRFHRTETAHFEIYTFDDPAADADIEAIGRTREKGFQSVAEWLGVDFEGKIRLFLFPDAETKLEETGHTGAGWAFGNVIVEIYNDRVRLDPYHEVVHILAEKLGDPPAMFGEGLAVYLSERLGADALKFLGSPGKTVDEVSRDLVRRNDAVPLEKLLAYTEIGSEESRPKVAYPESASIVKYLIETEGMDAFREAYETLENGSGPETAAENRRRLERIYGRSLEDIERGWRKSLH